MNYIMITGQIENKDLLTNFSLSILKIVTLRHICKLSYEITFNIDLRNIILEQKQLTFDHLLISRFHKIKNNFRINDLREPSI